MTEVLPWFFVTLAAGGIVVGLAMLWLSLRYALADEALGASGASLTSDARRALLTQKEALLQEIRDVTFEHEAGKLSDEDFRELNEKLRAQARRVLHELDEAAQTYRDEAEAMIAERLRQSNETASKG